MKHLCHWNHTRGETKKIIEELLKLSKPNEKYKPINPWIPETHSHTFQSQLAKNWQQRESEYVAKEKVQNIYRHRGKNSPYLLTRTKQMIDNSFESMQLKNGAQNQSPISYTKVFKNENKMKISEK